jgi:hypothetical protein
MAVSMQRVAVSILSICLGLFSAAGTAQADCVSACQASTYCDSEMHASGECGRRLNDCYINECNKKTYGAIAYGRESGAYGYAYDFSDPQSAENEAMSTCTVNGNDCRVVVDFWNTCAAIAADGNIVGYGLDDNESVAQDQALAACEKDGGSQCEVKAWSCNSQ